MDINSLNLGTAARGENAVLTPRGSDNEPVIMANGEVLTVTAYVPNSPQGQRVYRALAAKSAAKGDKNKRIDVDREIAEDVDFVTGMICDWNLVGGDGSPVPCNDENKRQFFDHFVALRVSVGRQIGQKIAELGESKPD